MRTQQKAHYLARRQCYARYMRRSGWLLWLPMQEVSGAIAHNRLYTGGAVPVWSNVQAPFTFTGDNPDSWSTVAEDANHEASEVGQGEGHGGSGTGYLNLWKNQIDAQPLVTQGGLMIGDTYRLDVGVDTYGEGEAIRTYSNGSLIGSAISAAGLTTHEFIATIAAAGIKLQSTSTNADITLSKVQAYKTGEMDALIAGTTALAQAGQLGVREAFLLDGATSLLTIANRAAIQGLSEFSLWLVFNPANAGEGNAGTLFSKSGEFELRFNSASLDLTATVNYSTTDATATTSTTLAADAWQSVGLRIDDTSKQIDIFVDGIEASYASRVAGAGTRVSNTNDLIVGNNGAVTQTLAGLLDEAALGGRALTDSEWLQLHRLAGLD